MEEVGAEPTGELKSAAFPTEAPDAKRVPLFVDYDAPMCGLMVFEARKAEATAGLSGHLSINGVRIGMTLAEVERKLGKDRYRFRKDPENGGVLLREDPPRTDLGPRDASGRLVDQPICFGTPPGSLGYANFTEVWVDDSDRVHKVSGANLESDGRIIGRETWSHDLKDLNDAYPVFAGDVEPARNKGKEAKLEYVEIGLTVSASSVGPYHFELGPRVTSF